MSFLTSVPFTKENQDEMPTNIYIVPRCSSWSQSVSPSDAKGVRKASLRFGGPVSPCPATQTTAKTTSPNRHNTCPRDVTRISGQQTTRTREHDTHLFQVVWKSLEHGMLVFGRSYFSDWSWHACFYSWLVLGLFTSTTFASVIEFIYLSYSVKIAHICPSGKLSKAFYSACELNFSTANEASSFLLLFGQLCMKTAANWYKAETAKFWEGKWYKQSCWRGENWGARQ